MNDSELAELVTRYPDLGTAVRVLRQESATNSEWLILESERGRFFAKASPPEERPASHTRREHQLIAHLVGKGFPTPAVLQSGTGDTVAVVAGRIWQLHQVATGEDRYGAAGVFEPFGSREELVSAGQALSRFHACARDLPNWQSPRIGPGLNATYFLAAAHDVKAELQKLLAQRPLARQFLGDRRDLDLAIDRFERLRLGVDPAALPRGIIHGDWIKRNLFFAGPEVSAVVDFDLANFGPLAFDLALAITAAAYPWGLVSQGVAPRIEHGRALLEGYEARRRLEDAERQSLPALLATCRFEFHIWLVATLLDRGSWKQAVDVWEGEVAMLGWWLKE